ncbi:MAG: hypothetical protein MHPSP_000180, partial [Paramarteilia canceri]
YSFLLPKNLIDERNSLRNEIDSLCLKPKFNIDDINMALDIFEPKTDEKMYSDSPGIDFFR